MKLDRNLILRILQGEATLDELAGVPIEELLAIRSDPDNVQWATFDSGVLVEEKDSVRLMQAAPAQRTIPYLMSSERGVGRTRDSILVRGWDLGDFEKRGNPFLYNHNLPDTSMHNGGLPLGRVDNVRKGSARGVKSLIGDAVFTPEGMVPFNDMVFRLADEGFMRGSSVGFHATKTRLPKNEEERAELGVGPMGVIHEATTLVEFSATPVGMDPDATKLTAIQERLRSWEGSGEFRREDVQRFREATRGLEPETRVQVQVPAMPFGAGVTTSNDVTTYTGTTTGGFDFSVQPWVVPARDYSKEIEALRTELTERDADREANAQTIRSLQDELAVSRQREAHLAARIDDLDQRIRTVLAALGCETPDRADTSDPHPGDDSTLDRATAELVDALFQLDLDPEVAGDTGGVNR